MFGFVAMAVTAAVVAEMNFERSIEHMPADAQERLRTKRREWKEALQRHARDTARHGGEEGDSALMFLMGVALGVGLA